MGRIVGMVTAALLLIAGSGCGAAGLQNQSGSPGRAVGSSTGSVLTTASNGGDTVSGFTLRFEADRQRSTVIVAHAKPRTITAHERPDARSPTVARLANPTDIGGPLAFLALERQVAENATWVEVYLPIRPNGSTGWVRRDQVELSTNPFRIEIDVGDHNLSVFKGGRRWLDATVAIGTGETPTPLGDFYIIELLQPPTGDGPYGPFAFGLSGFSETLTSYAGGDGVIGIHGTNEPASLGRDVSHGCIRVGNGIITSMAGVIPLGTPVHIRP